MNMVNESCLLSQALKAIGYMNEDNVPKQTAYCALADREADKLMDGYQSIFGQYDALALAHTMLTDFLNEEDAAALRLLLHRLYEQSGTDIPSFYLVLNRDTALFAFCQALSDSLRLLMDSAEDDKTNYRDSDFFGCFW